MTRLIIRHFPSLFLWNAPRPSSSPIIFSSPSFFSHSHHVPAREARRRLHAVLVHIKRRTPSNHERCCSRALAHQRELGQQATPTHKPTSNVRPKRKRHRIYKIVMRSMSVPTCPILRVPRMALAVLPVIVRKMAAKIALTKICKWESVEMSNRYAKKASLNGLVIFPADSLLGFLRMYDDYDNSPRE